MDELTGYEKFFLKKFIGAIGGLTAKSVTERILNDSLSFGSEEEFETMKYMIDENPTLSVLHSIYKKI